MGASPVVVDHGLPACAGTSEATRCGFALGVKGMKVWLRPSKWGEGVTQTAIQDMPQGTDFTHAAVDRAFYKASNVIALRDRTARVLRD